jgi:thioester reductase-like protein
MALCLPVFGFVVSWTAGLHPDASATLAEIGIDSLTAIHLMNTLKNTNNVHVPLTSLFSLSIAQLNELLAATPVPAPAAAATAAAAVVAASDRPMIVGRKVTMDWHSELEELMAMVQSVPLAAPQLPPTVDAPRHVLLTGATGFLGPVLLCHLLRKLPASTHITCVVRGPDPRARVLRAVAASGEAALAPALAATCMDQVTVLEGDVTQPRFGLPAAVYSGLLAAVTDIVHNAAQVSHVLPYRALRAANVIGTVHVAVFGRQSAHAVTVTHMSSVAALPKGAITSSAVPPRAPTSDEWADKDGYGQSKTVAEVVLLRAALPGKLFLVRPSLVSAHSATGFLNDRDWVTILLRTCKYLTVSSVKNATLRLEMVPVDWVAHVTATLVQHALGLPDGAHQFNVAQAGPTLEVILAAALPGLARVTAATWRAALAEALLPDPSPAAADGAVGAVGAEMAPATAALRTLVTKIQADVAAFGWFAPVGAAPPGVPCTASTRRLLRDVANANANAATNAATDANADADVDGAQAWPQVTAATVARMQAFI